MVALVFAVVQTLIEPGDSIVRSWVTVAVLAVAAVGGEALLGGRKGGVPTTGRVRLVGSAGMALDAAICVSVMFNNLTDPTDVIWVIVFMPIIEAALRWSLTGGIASGIGFGVATGAWGAAVNVTVGVPVDVAQLSLRASVIGIVGGFIGLLVSRLAGERRALQQVLHLTRDLMLTVDRDGHIVAANDAAMRVLGPDSHDVIGRPLAAFLLDEPAIEAGGADRSAHGAVPQGAVSHGAVPRGDRDHRHGRDHRGDRDPRHGRDHRDDLAELLRATELVERPFTQADGTVLWLELAVTADHEYGVTYVAGRDVTERREHARQLQHQAFHDPLTGVANRGRLMELLDEHITQPAGSLALLFVDLDRFKSVNDTLGHASGDDVLCAVVGRLRGCVRGGDVVARLAGDEFCVLLPDVAGGEEALEVAERMVCSLGQPYLVNGTEVCVSASVGAALNQSGDTADSLLHRADLAMYRAKESGRNRALFQVPPPDGPEPVARSAAATAISAGH